MDFKEGNVSSFEIVFKKYYNPLCNYAYSYLHEREEAEEVVQSSFLNLWEKRKKLEIKISFKSYLFMMIRNACLNKIKRSNLIRKHHVEVEAFMEVSRNVTMEKVVSVELEEKVEQSIQSLPEQCKLIFKLSRFEELKYEEIAKQLNLSVKTVENQISKALKIMRRELKEYLPLILLTINGLMEN